MRANVAVCAAAALAATGALADPASRQGDVVLDGDHDDPTSVVKELVDESVRDDEGLIQAGSGGAEPKENWMGCDLAARAGDDDACQDPPPEG